MQFKYYNCSLPDGGATIDPAKPLFPENELQVGVIQYLLARYPTNCGSIKIVDLGALEGGYGIELAKAGFNVTIIEARQENVNKCRWLAEQWNVDVRIIKGDARDFAQYGPFDVVLCLGLLYHFDFPVHFLQMAAHQTKDVLILQTHYANQVDPMYDQPMWKTILTRMIMKRLPWISVRKSHSLSQLTINEGYEGRYFKEYREKASTAEIEGSLLAAYGNPYSFWLTLPELSSVLTREFSTVEMKWQNVQADAAMFVCGK